MQMQSASCVPMSVLRACVESMIVVTIVFGHKSLYDTGFLLNNMNLQQETPISGYTKITYIP